MNAVEKTRLAVLLFVKAQKGLSLNPALVAEVTVITGNKLVMMRFTLRVTRGGWVHPKGANSIAVKGPGLQLEAGRPFLF